MGLTKKQKRDIQDKEFCKKLLTADWDGCAANDHFVYLCDTSPADRYYGKPKGEPWDSLRDIAIADSKLYYHIAPLAYEKNKILTFLRELTADTIFVPDNINDAEKFKATYMTTAKDILNKIERDAYDFQKPRH